MDKVQALWRQAEIDATVIREVVRALESLKLLHAAQLVLPGTRIVVDLTSDIERLTLALLMLGHCDVAA